MKFNQMLDTYVYRTNIKICLTWGSAANIPTTTPKISTDDNVIIFIVLSLSNSKFVNFKI